MIEGAKVGAVTSLISCRSQDHWFEVKSGNGKASKVAGLFVDLGVVVAAGAVLSGGALAPLEVALDVALVPAKFLAVDAFRGACS